MSILSESEIRNVSAGFYAALNAILRGNSGTMSGVWSQSPLVTTMHPLGERQVGWEKVRESWDQLASMARGGSVRLDDQLIRVTGDIAYEVGIERGSVTVDGQELRFENRVTNIYRQESSGWKLVHHHADVSPAMMRTMLPR
jgi:ketosteroid isomerase-like protein